MRDMLGREEVIPVEEALGRIFSHFIPKPPPSVKLPIDQSLGRVLSYDVFSDENLPEFRRSTVDGYAVSASDTFGATEGIPAYLNMRYEIKMGEEPAFELAKGEAARIATGGMLPLGADAVIMLEQTQQIDAEMIEAVKSLAPGENVIQAGDDVKKGDCILKKGHRLRPQDIGVLAGTGIPEIAAYGKPKVSIISTGDEIVPPERPVKPGQVRDMNSYNLAGLISSAGGIPLRKGIFSDEYTDIRSILESSMKDSGIILITGGSSVGTKDMTAQVINDIGEPGVLFHGVALKPGKPLIGGLVHGIPVFGLPGHPAAVTVCFYLFILPVLKALSGESVRTAGTIKDIIRARIDRNIASGPGREEHIGVSLEERNGELWAVPLLGKSGLLTTMIKSDGLAIIPLRKTGLEAGEIVEVRLF